MSLPERQPDGAVLTPVGQVRTRVRTSDRVYDELVSAIRDLRIAPGAALSETELAAQLQVSRTPLREAIARLVDNGLVSVVPQVGTRVELIGFRDVKEACFVRETLEVAAFGMARGHESQAVEPLRSLLKEQQRAHKLRDIDAFFAADEALHEYIFIEAGYPGTWAAIQPMRLQPDRLLRLSLPDAAMVGEFIREHMAIVDAFAAGDVPRGGRSHPQARAARARARAAHQSRTP